MEELLGLAGKGESVHFSLILSHELISTHQRKGFHQQEQCHNDQNLAWLEFGIHVTLSGLFDGFPKKNGILSQF